MNILLLCGYHEAQYEAELAARSKAGMEHAANLFQKRLIDGLRSQPCALQIVSAPFIGSWPDRSSLAVFRGFRAPSQEGIVYVPFLNLWGLRSISRARALQKPVDDFVAQTQGTERAVVIYAPHTPFLKAAAAAKRHAPDLRICLIVPDLPQYMNLSQKPHRIYDFCKSFDVRYFERLNRQVDAYWLLTEAMAEALHLRRPYMVTEGMAEADVPCSPPVRSKTFVYAGKLTRRFGIQRLLDAFALLEEAEYRLLICGAGEMAPDVLAAAQADSRIRYAGVLTPDELAQVFRTAGVLVNPRTDDAIYTRYSFPSKVIDYLQTGLPVVSAKLEGMPEVYRRLLYCPADNSAAALCSAMKAAMSAGEAAESERLQAVRSHLRTLAPSAAAGRLLSLLQAAEPFRL